MDYRFDANCVTAGRQIDSVCGLFRKEYKHSPAFMLQVAQNFLHCYYNRVQWFYLCISENRNFVHSKMSVPLKVIIGFFKNLQTIFLNLSQNSNIWNINLRYMVWADKILWLETKSCAKTDKVYISVFEMII